MFGFLRAESDEQRLRGGFEHQLDALRSRLDAGVLHDARELAAQIASELRPAPSSVTVQESEGRALFSLFGANGREVDLWVDGSGNMLAILSGPVEDDEMRIPIARFPSIASWLRG